MMFLDALLGKEKAAATAPTAFRGRNKSRGLRWWTRIRGQKHKCTSHSVGVKELIARAPTLADAEEALSHGLAHHKDVSDDTRRKWDKAILGQRMKAARAAQPKGIS